MLVSKLGQLFSSTLFKIIIFVFGCTEAWVTSNNNVHKSSGELVEVFKLEQELVRFVINIFKMQSTKE